MDAFNGMGPSVTDTLVRALTKLSTSQEAMNKSSNEKSKNVEERNTTLNNQNTDFQKTNHNSPRRARFRKTEARARNFQQKKPGKVLRLFHR